MEEIPHECDWEDDDWWHALEDDTYGFECWLRQMDEEQADADDTAAPY